LCKRPPDSFYKNGDLNLERSVSADDPMGYVVFGIGWDMCDGTLREGHWLGGAGGPGSDATTHAVSENNTCLRVAAGTRQSRTGLNLQSLKTCCEAEVQAFHWVVIVIVKAYEEPPSTSVHYFGPEVIK